ncbi:hypothetical protein [Mesobacillus foraminis]|uniref:Relaxasome subunit MobC n=1 Tax=Mesobacillus foraminis TaxID=279826 RepID=A0A4R2AZ84_9BACI|nr:hypothetical protein [Mesobacillus foraminis]TCN18412.1 hypothetical protein EV146_12010 [Mesobacillus foraminis]
MSEEIQKIEDKIKVLEQKKKSLEHKIVSEERRVRTRGLIQKGALLEKYLDLEKATIEDTELLLKVLSEFKKRNADYVIRKIEQLKEEDPL